MSPKVIGFTGKAQSGKDTAADIMLEHLPGYTKASFADPIKEMLRVGLGLTEDQLYGPAKDRLDDRYGCTPRHMAQSLGTEWGRDLIHPDVWVIANSDKARIIIPDVRFENEATFVRSRGILIHVRGRGGLFNGGDHISEDGVGYLCGDVTLANTGTLEEYRLEVLRLMMGFVR